MVKNTDPEIIPVENTFQVAAVTRLAAIIWNQHFVPIIGQDQVNYMLTTLQSEAAITDQITAGYAYYLLVAQGENVGYLALKEGEPQDALMISKIYVDHHRRGAGHGQILLDFAIEQSRRAGLKKVWLTVNRHNDLAIQWYLKRGFEITRELKQDIGHGFFMDDYVMRLVTG